MAWLDRVQNRDRWRALVNAVMDHFMEFHKMQGIS